MIKQHKFQVEELKIDIPSTPTNVLLDSNQRKTPLRTRKKKSKKSKETTSNSSFNSSQNLTLSQNLTSSQNEIQKTKTKNFTKKIEENIIEIGLKKRKKSSNKFIKKNYKIVFLKFLFGLILKKMKKYLKIY